MRQRGEVSLVARHAVRIHLTDVVAVDQRSYYFRDLHQRKVTPRARHKPSGKLVTLALGAASVARAITYHQPVFLQLLCIARHPAFRVPLVSISSPDVRR